MDKTLRYALIIFGKAEREKFEICRSEYSQKVEEIYDEAKTYQDGKYHLVTNDVVRWCRERIAEPDSIITRKGKNWYIKNDDCEITVNAYSYTIITAHKG